MISKKFLCIYACVAVLGAVGITSLCVANNGSITPISITNKFNAVALSEGLFTNSVEGAHKAGNAVYFCPETSISWWISDDAETRFYFYDDVTTKDGWSDVVKYDYNRDANKPMYFAEAPSVDGVSSWTKFKAVRRKKGEPVGWADGVTFNQTAEYTIYESSTYRNTIGVYNNGSDQDYCMINSAAERIRVFAWSKDWLKPGAYSSCSPTEDLVEGTFASDWAATGTAFNSLGEDVKYAFSHIAAAADADDAEQPTIAGTAARYDWIYKKYVAGKGWSLSNWADRSIA